MPELTNEQIAMIVNQEMARQYMIDFQMWAVEMAMKVGLPPNTINAGRQILATLQNPQQPPKKEDEKTGDGAE